MRQLKSNKFTKWFMQKTSNLPAFRSWYQSSDNRRRLYAVSLISSGWAAMWRSAASATITKDSVLWTTTLPTVNWSLAAAPTADGVSAVLIVVGGGGGGSLPLSQVSRNRHEMWWWAALMSSISRRYRRDATSATDRWHHLSTTRLSVRLSTMRFPAETTKHCTASFVVACVELAIT